MGKATQEPITVAVPINRWSLLTVALVALLMSILMIVRGNGQIATQLLGSLLVMAISFSAQNVIVYTFAVLVIATLVTELHFLEKIAALMWNRKEY